MRKIYPAILLVAVFVSGCDLFYILGLPFGKRIPFNPKKSLTSTSVQRDVQFPDIPVPLSFLLRRNEFYSYRCPTFRLGTFVYEGAWTYRNTYKFYNQQMPLSGWTKTYEEDGYGTNLSVWSKGNERCRVLINDLEQQVKVKIKVYPQR